MGAARRQPAGLLDPRPGQAKGAEFGQGDEFVRVGREAKRDHRPRCVERNARRVQRAQEADAGAERETELLARSAARRMNAPRVGDDERSGEAPGSQRQRPIDIRLDVSRPVGGKPSMGGGGERIETERDGAIDGTGTRSLDEGGEAQRVVRAVAAEVEFEARPGVEAHAFASGMQSRRIGRLQPESIGADRPGEHDLEAVRAAGEIVQRLGVGFAGVRMVEPRHDAPGSVRTQRARAVRRRIERRDPNSVRGHGREALETLPLQGRLGGLAPVGFAEGRKDRCVRAQRQISFR